MVAVMACYRIIAETPIKVMALVAGILVRFLIFVPIIIAVCPAGSRRGFTAVFSEMALEAFLS